jgi:hypothetical protein
MEFLKLIAGLTMVFAILFIGSYLIKEGYLHEKGSFSAPSGCTASPEIR